MTSESRYAGKPILGLLECYVLWAIDRLPAEKADNLRAMEPQLRSTFKVAHGTWQEIIASVMDLPPTMPELIRGSWTKNTQIAKQHGVELEPQKFAEMFVDANLT